MVSLSSRMCSFCLITLNNSGFWGLNVDKKELFDFGLVFLLLVAVL